MKPRDHLIATLVLQGYSSQEISERVGISARSVERARALPEVRAFVAEREATGATLSPKEVLRALLSSASETVRLQAALALEKIDPEEPQPEERELPEGAVTLIIHPAGRA